MTQKTKELLFELTEALYEKKALLIVGNSGVGKTYMAKQAADCLKNKKYNLSGADDEGNVIRQIISCHGSVAYEDVIGGITAETTDGKMLFAYKDKIVIETLTAAAADYEAGKENRYVLIFDDIQRNDMGSLLGDAIEAIGNETSLKTISLNSGVTVKIPPNFYVIATCNLAERGAKPLGKERLSKFYMREILSDIEYITEDKNSENVSLYEKVRELVFTCLDLQYKQSTYEQNRYLPGHGYFCGKNILLKLKYQLIPVLKQYVAEGILDKNAEERIRLLEAECNDKKKKTVKTAEENCFSAYRQGVTSAGFLIEDGLDEQKPRNSKPSVPIENLVGRFIDQRLLLNDEIRNHILFNPCICYREAERGGVTYQAQLLASNEQYNNIRRGGSDGRKLYNGGTIKIGETEYHFTGGMQPKEYTVRNPKQNRKEIWEITGRYEIGESTSPNVILFKMIWQYYKTLTDNFKKYTASCPEDGQKKKLLEFMEAEWREFLKKFKEIRPEQSSDKNIMAENNKEANRKVRELISQLKILWCNPGDSIILSDGSTIMLEGVDNDMSDSVYKEYHDAMELLGIRQMILQGPPGTSKTYSAKAFLRYLAGNCTESELDRMQIRDYEADDYCQMLGDGKGNPRIAWDIVQFHPSYGYEDFIRGIKVSTSPESSDIVYETVNKVLGSMAELAEKHEKYGTKFYLIIDEINRANLATVFGELIYGLEYRTEAVATPYTVEKSNKISLPENLYIIGTMNTADKSIGGIDYAIRRRFLFFEQLPDISVIQGYKAELGDTQMQINARAAALFEKVADVFGEDYLSPEYRKEDVQIGHTYFLVDSKEQLRMRFEYQIIPILKEYFKDGIIGFDAEEGEDGFNGLLNCIMGRINLASEKAKVDKIFNDLIS